MKKISTYLASALLTLVVLSSCSSRPEDINVADLKEPCDFVNAAEQVLDAIIEITEDVKSPDLLTEDDKRRGHVLAKKFNEIGEEYGEKFDTINEPNCPNWEELIKKRERSNWRIFLVPDIIIDEEPCDYVDAAEQVLDAIIEITEDVKSPDLLTEDDKKRGHALAKKFDEISEAYGEKFDTINDPNCPNWEELIRKREKSNWRIFLVPDNIIDEEPCAL